MQYENLKKYIDTISTIDQFNLGNEFDIQNRD